jgi:DNA-binding NarL/FixJ family response regulator
VKVYTRASKDFWNDLVAHLSGGLLYGAEVSRPAWLTRQRRRPYAPRPNAPPAHRRLMVQERLLKGWPYKRIAADMHISPGTVDTHAQAIYAQHRVHGRAALIRQLGATPEVELTHWRDRRAICPRPETSKCV